MLNPSSFLIKDISEISHKGDIFVVSIRPYREYIAGTAGDFIGHKYELVFPSNRFEHLFMKILGAPLINPDIFASASDSIKIRDIKDFEGKWYKNSATNDYALTCEASSFTVCKEDKI